MPQRRVYRLRGTIVIIRGHFKASLIIVQMRIHAGVVISSLLALSACRNPQPSNAVVVAGGKVIQVHAATRVPETLIGLAGIELAAGDLILERGYEVDPGLALPAGRQIVIQIQSPILVYLNGQPLRTTARTVGEALVDEGAKLWAADRLVPAPDVPISPELEIQYLPSRELRLTIDGAERSLRTTSGNVGAALAEAGLPMIGLDTGTPPETQSVPKDGQVRFARVSESLVLIQEPIAYESRSQDSVDLELGLEQVLEPGINGLAVSRTRIRYEEGNEVSRQAEGRVIVRPPRDRLVLRGTKIVENTASVDGVTISYWRAMQMYATVYSPCNSGTGDGSCSSATASGLPAGKGVVAVDPDLFAYLNGQRLYIPGYGYAVVGDIGGGYIVEQKLGISRYKWIDLGFDDNNIQDMTGWITVYFLAPVPASIPDVLK